MALIVFCCGKNMKMPRHGSGRSRRGRQTRRLAGGAITRLTEVQARCLVPGIAGKDILARSKTGSGKSLSFLMVGVERILRHGGPDPLQSFPIVVMTPVTDLASQIANVARAFLKYHAPMQVDLVIGGTDERKDMARLSSGQHRVDVLVATPGRLKSLLQQSEPIRRRLAGCQTFVIDEVDKLTDPGFLRDIKYIHSCAADGNARMQTLMYSATMDKDTIMSTGLISADAEFVDAATGVIRNTGSPSSSVRRIVVVSPVSHHFDVVVNIVNDQMKEFQKPNAQKGGDNANANANAYRVDKQEMLSEGTLQALGEWDSPSMNGYRIMVFLPSNAYIDCFAAAFREHFKDKVRSMVLHGGLPQHKRTKVSDEFRTTDNCVLFTSDASARGVDYPDVTCVMQLGFDSRSEYMQRAGRTGRAGKSGKAFLVISPEELRGADQVCEVLTDVFIDSTLTSGVEYCPSFQFHEYGYTGVSFPASDQRVKKEARQGYRGWLGSLASRWKRLKMSTDDVLRLAVDMSDTLGLQPMDDAKLRDKLHIKGR